MAIIKQAQRKTRRCATLADRRTPLGAALHCICLLGGGNVSFQGSKVKPNRPANDGSGNRLQCSPKAFRRDRGTRHDLARSARCRRAVTRVDRRGGRSAARGWFSSGRSGRAPEVTVHRLSPCFDVEFRFILTSTHARATGSRGHAQKQARFVPIGADRSIPGGYGGPYRRSFSDCKIRRHRFLMSRLFGRWQASLVRRTALDGYAAKCA